MNTIQPLPELKEHIDNNYVTLAKFYDQSTDLNIFLAETNKVLIFYSPYGDLSRDSYEPFLIETKELYEKTGIKNKFFIFLDFNNIIPKDIKDNYKDVFTCIDLLYGHGSYIPYFPKNILVKEKNFKYHFLSLNARSTFTRLSLFFLFYRHNLLEKSNFSYIGSTFHNQGNYDELVKLGADFTLNEFLVNKNDRKIDPESLKQLLPYRLTEYDANNELECFPKGFYKHNHLINVFGNDWTKTNYNEVYKRSVIQIISESCDGDNQGQFLSEKTFKSIIGYQPFLLLSGKGSLKKLRQIGFKTFPEIFDESYDEMDLPHRFESVYKEIVRLGSLKLEDLSKLFEKVKHSLEHNYNYFYSDFLKNYEIEQHNLQTELAAIISKESKNFIDFQQ